MFKKKTPQEYATLGDVVKLLDVKEIDVDKLTYFDGKKCIKCGSSLDLMFWAKENPSGVIGYWIVNALWRCRRCSLIYYRGRKIKRIEYQE